MVCKGLSTSACAKMKECFNTRANKRKSYCRRRGKGKNFTCRGRPVDDCASEKCTVTQGPMRFYCRKNTRSRKL